ncbi:MAG: phage holin family protein [Chthoniobacteraceae bacterium]
MNRNPSSPAGLFSHSASALAATVRYWKARLTLVGIEAREAGGHYGIAAAMLAGALFVAILGYVFLIITLVFAIAAAFDSAHAWLGVMAAAALLHLAGAAALVWLAGRRLRKGAFPATLAEFQKDQQWLTQLTKKP